MAGKPVVLATHNMGGSLSDYVLLTGMATGTQRARIYSACACAIMYTVIALDTGGVLVHGRLEYVNKVSIAGGQVVPVAHLGLTARVDMRSFLARLFQPWRQCKRWVHRAGIPWRWTSRCAS